MPILGIAISKATFDVALLEVGNEIKIKKFSNNPKGFAALQVWLLSHKVYHAHACMEAIGCYGVNLAKYLYSNNFKVSVVHSASVKAFGDSRLVGVKTGKADGLLIAHFCLAMCPELWEPTGMMQTKNKKHQRRNQESKNNKRRVMVLLFLFVVTLLAETCNPGKLNLNDKKHRASEPQEAMQQKNRELKQENREPKQEKCRIAGLQQQECLRQQISDQLEKVKQAERLLKSKLQQASEKLAEVQQEKCSSIESELQQASDQLESVQQQASDQLESVQQQECLLQLQQIRGQLEKVRQKKRLLESELQGSSERLAEVQQQKCLLQQVSEQLAEVQQSRRRERELERQESAKKSRERELSKKRERRRTGLERVESRERELSEKLEREITDFERIETDFERIETDFERIETDFERIEKELPRQLERKIAWCRDYLKRYHHGAYLEWRENRIELNEQNVMTEQEQGENRICCILCLQARIGETMSRFNCCCKATYYHLQCIVRYLQHITTENITTESSLLYTPTYPTCPTCRREIEAFVN